MGETQLRKAYKAACQKYEDVLNYKQSDFPMENEMSLDRTFLERMEDHIWAMRQEAIREHMYHDIPKPFTYYRFSWFRREIILKVVVLLMLTLMGFQLQEKHDWNDYLTVTFYIFIISTILGLYRSIKTLGMHDEEAIDNDHLRDESNLDLSIYVDPVKPGYLKPRHSWLFAYKWRIASHHTY